MTTGLLITIAGRLGAATATRLASRALQSVEKETLRCPHCSGVIYSRRFATCRDCGADLPAGSRFAPQQTAKVQAELDASHHRVRSLNSSLEAIRPIGTLAL